MGEWTEEQVRKWLFDWMDGWVGWVGGGQRNR